MFKRLEVRSFVLLALIGLGAALWTGLRSMTRGESDRSSLSLPAPVLLEESHSGAIALTPAQQQRSDRSHRQEASAALAPEVRSLRAGRFGPEVPRAGRTAALNGRVVSGEGGVPARIEFVLGLNEGRALLASPGNSFEVGDLYPGFALVRVSAPGLGSLTRDVRLQPGASVELVIDLAGRRAIQGRVTDAEGRGLAFAEVTVDGVETHAGADGWYQAQALASGRPLVIIRKPGYAAFYSTALGPAPDLEDGRLDVVLEPGCELEITPRLDTAAGECLVYLAPRGGQRSGGRGGASFPWYFSSPTRVAANESLRLRDLPRGRVEVYLIHPLGSARSGIRDLQPGACVPVELELRARPVLEGRVLLGGEPLAGARVTLEAANRLRASVASLAGAEELYRHVPLVDLPAAHQETWTDSRGHFRLGDWSHVSGQRFLTVRSPGETIEVTRELVKSMDCTIELASFTGQAGGKWSVAPLDGGQLYLSPK